MSQQRESGLKDSSMVGDSRRSRLLDKPSLGMFTGEGAYLVGLPSWMRHRQDGPEEGAFAVGAVLGDGDLMLMEKASDSFTAYRTDSRTGEVLWRRVLSERVESLFVGASAARCGGGEREETVIVGGHTVVPYGAAPLREVTRTFMRPAAVKLDARSGEERWRFETTPGGFIEDDGGWSTPTDGQALGVSTDPDGDVFLVGYYAEKVYREDNSAYETTSFVMKLDGVTGRVLWTRASRRIPHDYVFIAAVSDSEGNLIAAGYSGSVPGVGNQGGRDYLAVKFDPDGRPLWEHQVGDASDEGYFAVAVDSANDVYLGGGEEVIESRIAGISRPVLHKRDGADGRNLWTYSGMSGPSTMFLGIGFDEASGVVVCSGQKEARWAPTEYASGTEEEEGELLLALVDGEDGEELEQWLYGTFSDEGVVVLAAVSPDRSVELGGYTPHAWGAASAGVADTSHPSLRASRRNLAGSGVPTASPTIAPTQSRDSASASDDSDDSSSLLGLGVPAWVVPAVGGAVAAVGFLSILACGCWCWRRRRKHCNKNRADETSASHEPQVVAGPVPQRHTAAAPGGVVLLSSTSSTSKGQERECAGAPDDAPGETPTDGDPKIDQIAIEESPAVPVVPSSGTTAPTATASATATSVTSSCCESLPEKPESTLAGCAGGTAALTGDGELEFERHESVGASSGVSIGASSSGEVKDLEAEGAEARTEDTRGGRHLSIIGRIQRLQKPSIEAQAPARVYQAAGAPNVEGSRVNAVDKGGGGGGGGSSSSTNRKKDQEPGNMGGEQFEFDPQGGDFSDDEDELDDTSDRNRAQRTEVKIDLSAAPMPGQMPALLTPDQDCMLVIEDDFDGSEDTPTGFSMTWGGTGNIPIGVSDFGDVEMGSEDRSSRSSRRSSYYRRISSDQNDDRDRSLSQDARSSIQDHSGRSFDDISLSSMQMPELLSPPFPGMLPVPSTFSTSGIDGYDSLRTPGQSHTSGGHVGAPSPRYYSKSLSSAGSPMFYDVPALRSMSSRSSHTYTDRSSPMPAPKGIYRPRKVAIASDANTASGASKAQLPDPPTYETLNSAPPAVAPDLGAVAEKE